MLEVAITSLKCALRDDFDEFREFFEAKPWEPVEIQNSEFEIRNEKSGEAEIQGENAEEAQDAESADEKCEIPKTTKVTIDINGKKFTLTKREEPKADENDAI